MKKECKEIFSELETLADEEKRDFLPYFFKTGKGQYGEGDKFMGVVVPKIKLVAKDFQDASLDTIQELLESPWHEMRSCALFILCLQVQKGVSREIFDFYLSQTHHINNWDLVDALSLIHI